MVGVFALMLQLLVDITMLGPGARLFPDAVELDGRSETREWVANATLPGPTQGFIRAIQVPGVNGGLCIGPWYDARHPSLRGLVVETHLALINGRTHYVAEIPGVVYFEDPIRPPTTCQ